jgi:DNA-binding response OmpR family regulator
MKVLLVDDDTELLDVTAYALRREGLNIIVATDGSLALRRWQAEEPDVVVLDVGLAHVNGYEVCRQIRQASTTPVIFVTGLTDNESIVRGFRAGADDYVTKPFSTRQLAMRIHAILRRRAQSPVTEPVREVQVGELMLDPGSQEVSWRGSGVRLTRTEFRLLYLLALNAGRVVRSERLVEYALGYDHGESSLLRTHVSHIRRKLQLPPRGPGSIAVLPCVGYRLNAALTSAAEAN